MTESEVCSVEEKIWATYEQIWKMTYSLCLKKKFYWYLYIKHVYIISALKLIHLEVWCFVKRQWKNCITVIILKKKKVAWFGGGGEL